MCLVHRSGALLIPDGSFDEDVALQRAVLVVTTAFKTDKHKERKVK
jgi:hypothetical protein